MNFFDELFFLIGCRVSLLEAETLDILKDVGLPIEEQIYSNHDSLMSHNNARQSELENTIARMQRLAKNHNIELPPFEK